MSLSENTFQLGERVRITGTAVKTKVYDARSYQSNLVYRDAGLPAIKDAWDRSYTVDEGVVVGYRSVMEGTVVYDYDDGAGFRPKTGSARRVWLVAFNIRRNPVMVFDHQIERMTND